MNPAILKIHLKGSKTDKTKIGLDLCVGSTQWDMPSSSNAGLSSCKGPRWGTTVQEMADHYCKGAFPIGAATTAITRDISESTVQTLGRWASDSIKKVCAYPPWRLTLSVTAASGWPGKVIAVFNVVCVCVCVWIVGNVAFEIGNQTICMRKQINKNKTVISHWQNTV